MASRNDSDYLGKHKHKYGFVEIENPESDYDFNAPEYLLRKATPEQRRTMLINAIANRNMIATKICMFLGISTHSDFETIHNYIDDNNIVRKGAISAKKGELVIIPMNMRDGSLLAIGKGNPDWNESAPHGAGRILSRKAARENLSLSDFKKEMSGIYSTTVLAETIDEAPMAYKPMSEIIKNIKDTVKVIEVIKPVYNFKAAEDIKSYSRKKEDIDDNE